MTKFDLSELPYGAKIHFIGVGGISMTALAEIMLSKGYKVSGSDINRNPIVDRLVAMGLVFYDEHCADNVQGVDLVVYTAAIHPDNPELVSAIKHGIKAIERPVLLGAIMRGFARSIAIAGTHGKTTTTSMMSYILVENNADPTILVGGELELINGNIRTGRSDYFLAEACEYHRSFLEFSPFGAVVLNIEPDHLDYYKDEADYISAFTEFSEIIPPSGFLVVNADDTNTSKIVSDLKCRIINFGIESQAALITARNIRYEDGITVYDLFVGGTFVEAVRLRVVGKHNVLNSLASLSCSFALGIDIRASITALSHFTGVGRRFERKGSFNGAVVVDDYAHHPTEIKATLSTAADMGYNRIWCAFQPHTYSRTKALLDTFSTSFDGVHKVLLADIYAAREPDDGSINSQMLSDRINANTSNSIYLGDFKSIEEYLRANAIQGDLIICMGAGDIYKVSEHLVTNL